LGVSVSAGVDDPDLEDIIGGGPQNVNKRIDINKDWYPYDSKMVSNGLVT